jgi:vacuolar protein sorting-associated protein 29
MDVQGPVIVTYVYQLVEGEVSLDPFCVEIRSCVGVFKLMGYQVKVDKVEYRRPDKPREGGLQAGNGRTEVAAGW